MPQYSDDVLFDSEGKNVGHPDARPDMYARNLDISGSLSGSFVGASIFNLGQKAVTFISNPVFDALQSSSFIITLTGNVVSSTITNLKAGQLVAFVIKQDATGGRAFVWPSNARGGMDIGTDPNETSVQLFISDGTLLYGMQGAIF